MRTKEHGPRSKVQVHPGVAPNPWSCLLQKILPATCPWRRTLYLLPFLSIILITTLSHAENITLAWDPNSKDVDGYKIFARLEDNQYDYSNPAWSGTLTSCTLSGFPPNATFCFVARAFKGDDESGDSNEVCYKTKSLTIKLED